MCRIFNTPVIKFVVGKQEKEMMMHTILVAEQSRALKSLVNGPMKEAQNNTVIWKDINEQTFALFAEFVYTGRYTLPIMEENQVTGSGVKSPPLTNRIITVSSAQRWPAYAGNLLRRLWKQEKNCAVKGVSWLDRRVWGFCSGLDMDDLDDLGG